MRQRSATDTTRRPQVGRPLVLDLPLLRRSIVLGLLFLLVTPQLTQAQTPPRPAAVEQSLAQARAARGKTVKGALRASGQRLVKGAGWAARKVGGAVDRQAAALDERGHHRTAKTIKLLAGTDTLLNTSFDIGFGVGMAAPFARVFNMGVGCGLWSGSIKHHESGVKDVMFNKSVGIDSPFFGGGYSTLGKWGGGLYPLPFVSGFKDQRSYGLSIGNSGLVDLVFGEVGPTVNKDGQHVPTRGPFVDFHMALPVLPFVSYLSVYIGVTSPLLKPITKPMERPAAWLDDRGRVLSESITRAGQKKLLKAHPELKSASQEHLLSALVTHDNLPQPLRARKFKKQGPRLALVEKALANEIEVPLNTLLRARRDALKVKNYLEGAAPLRDKLRALRHGKKALAAVGQVQAQAQAQAPEQAPAGWSVAEAMPGQSRLQTYRRGRVQSREHQLKGLKQALAQNQAVSLDALLAAQQSIGGLWRLAEQQENAPAREELAQLLESVRQGILSQRAQQSATVKQLKQVLTAGEYEGLTTRLDSFLRQVNRAIERERQEGAQIPQAAPQAPTPAEPELATSAQL